MKKKKLLTLVLTAAFLFSAVLPSTIAFAKSSVSSTATSAITKSIIPRYMEDRNYICMSSACNGAIRHFIYKYTPDVRFPGYYCTVCGEKYWGN